MKSSETNKCKKLKWKGETQQWGKVILQPNTKNKTKLVSVTDSSNKRECCHRIQLVHEQHSWELRVHSSFRATSRLFYVPRQNGKIARMISVITGTLHHRLTAWRKNTCPAPHTLISWSWALSLPHCQQHGLLRDICVKTAICFFANGIARKNIFEFCARFKRSASFFGSNNF